MQKKTISLLEKVKALRQFVLRTCLNAGTGHVSSSFSCVEILAVLYYAGILRYKIGEPKWNKRDRFILSKAQASPLLYTILADLGFFPLEYLKTFAKQDGKMAVHLQNTLPGVETSGGSLGLGLGIACGMAYALKSDKHRPFVFCLLGDAECYEGSIWEAALMASHHKLNNLIAIVDRNWMGATDFTEDMCSLGSLKNKWESFGWEAECVNGHSLRELYSKLCGFRSKKRDKPYILIADTTKGKSCPIMEGEPLYHSRVPECRLCKIKCGLKGEASAAT